MDQIQAKSIHMNVNRAIFFGCVSTTVVSLYDEVLKPESGLVVPDNVNVVPIGLYINCAIVITTELLIPFSSEPTMQR